ncbi:hypothetical protein M3Y98_00092200 [Aphelenchoides besseyi]|nr:hypothetical protein M3Y98_00092200 [Aphelenchoides besseyi]KAI6198521.1 hypothetical protein M3Y96_00527900 [Aphelenchoides besseyi]
MEWFLIERNKYERLYNCSFYDYQRIPVEQRQHKFLGLVIIVSYALFMTCYVPCLYAMMASEHRRKASYRLMFLLGVIHVLDLQFCGLETGILAIVGAAYCEHPILIYVSGSIAVACWCASTMTSMLLGINRCCELFSSHLANLIFGSWRIGFWILLPIIYFVFISGYTPPGIFYGVQLAWFFNPHVGYFEDTNGRYVNMPHTINNFVVCSTEFLIYITLIALYIRATKSQSGAMKTAMNRERKIYIQIILVGTIHFIAGFTYVLMQFFEVDFYATLVASTFYLLSQGAPGIIYLSMNRSIRNVLRAKMGLKKEFPSRVRGLAANSTTRHQNSQFKETTISSDAH